MKKNVLIILLIIIILGLGGYLVYDKVINNNKEEVNNGENIVNNEQTNVNNNYEIYSDNLINKMNSYYIPDDGMGGGRDTWKYLYVNNLVSETHLTFELKTNGDVYANLDSRLVNSNYEKKLLSKYGESYKLSSEIIDIYMVPEGNGGYAASLYMIKKDGSLKKLHYSYDSNESEYKIEDNYKNLKNIIYVTSHPSFGTGINFATDINGKFYDLSN